MDTKLSDYILAETQSSQETAIKKEELIREHIEIEKKALSYMLMDDKTAILGCKILSPLYFAHGVHEHIFKVIKHHIDNNENVIKAQNVLLTTTEADWQKINPTTDVKKYFKNLLISNLDLFNPNHANQLCETIKDQYTQRLIIKDHVQRINTILLTTSLARSTKDLLSDMSKNLEIILSYVDNENNMQDAYDIIWERLNKPQVPKILTGYKSLDKIIGGFTPTNLVTIGGAPGSGKSAFALNIAMNMCKNNVKVAFWSFEMNEREISDRILSINTLLNFSNSEIIDEEHYNAGRKYVDNIQDQLKISTTPIYNIDTFYLICRNLKNKWGLQIVFIDYLQLIHLHQNFGNNRVKEITYITNMLKKFAQDLGIVIVILSQFSKEITKRANDTPCLADLKDSSSIEQDSNIVILLHNPPKAEGNPFNYDGRIIKIIVAKNRSGITESIGLPYIGHLTKFTE